jgi:hypothetical protein
MSVTMSALTRDVDDLPSSAARLLTAFSADKRCGRPLTLTAQNREVLGRAVTFIEELLSTLASVADGTCVSIAPEPMVALDVVTHSVSATGLHERCTVADRVSYLEGLRGGLGMLRDSGLDAVDEEFLMQAQYFFRELFSRLPDEAEELREVLIPVEVEIPHSMLQELEKIAAEARGTVSNLVTKIILTRLNGTKGAAIERLTAYPVEVK